MITKLFKVMIYYFFTVYSINPILGFVVSQLHHTLSEPGVRENTIPTQH